MEMSLIFDLIVVAMLFFCFIAISSEGFWGATIALFNIMFSALIAMNFADKLATKIISTVSFLSGFADCLSLGGIFAVTLLTLRFLTDYLAPGKLRLPGPVEAIGKLVFGAASSVLLVGFLLIVMQAAPVHKKLMWGMYAPETQKPPFGLGVDKLALQFLDTSLNGPFKKSGSSGFDPDSWVAGKLAARPYDNTVDENAPAGGTPETGGPAAGSAPVQGSMNVPGGTVGAAAGLAPPLSQ
jgi:uncharacterized membrane protein required for colicin V production